MAVTSEPLCTGSLRSALLFVTGLAAGAMLARDAAVAPVAPMVLRAEGAARGCAAAAAAHQPFAQPVFVGGVSMLLRHVHPQLPGDLGWQQRILQNGVTGRLIVDVGVFEGDDFTVPAA